MKTKHLVSGSGKISSQLKLCEVKEKWGGGGAAGTPILSIKEREMQVYCVIILSKHKL